MTYKPQSDPFLSGIFGAIGDAYMDALIRQTDEKMRAAGIGPERAVTKFPCEERPMRGDSVMGSTLATARAERFESSDPTNEASFHAYSSHGKVLEFPRRSRK